MNRWMLLAVSFLIGGISFAEDDVASASENASVETVTAQWVGDWVSDRGLISLKRTGDQLMGTLDGNVALSGVVEGGTLQLDYKSNNLPVKAMLTLDESGHWFSGDSKFMGRSRAWIGCRDQTSSKDSDAVADFSGHWLLSWGIARLTQQDNKVQGKYSASEYGSLSGTVKGRRLMLEWKRLRSKGKAWIEQSEDGKRLLGRTIESEKPSVIIGLRADRFEHHVQPVAGEIVRGWADNGMLYYLRMPDQWKPGDDTNVVVLLHGSNFTTAGMVAVTARKWPEIGRRFAILGIEGRRWVKSSTADDLRFNYSYVNWMGRSTYKGFPFTDRESPTLVMDVIDELDELYNFASRFVGGHSQGGYLAYILHMHFPEKLSGTFPIAGGMIMQAEPDVFEDAGLQTAQRLMPMAIIHGTQDRVVRYSSSTYSYARLRAHDFHHVKLFSPEAGHPYDFLPIGEAIQWLEMTSSHDVTALARWAEQQSRQAEWRDVGVAIARARAINAEAALATVIQQYEAAATEEAEKHLSAIAANEDRSWFDPFLKWYDQFAATEAAKPAREAFSALRAEHLIKAKELETAARKAFRARDSDLGWEKYREIVEQCYAAPQYRTLKEKVAKHFEAKK